MTQSTCELIQNDKALFTRKTLAILLPILLVAAVLRLIFLGQSPPGLNQDEAVNAWNAWCLLKTGTDQCGVSWPIFYYRGLGGNYSTLYLYILIPFQAVGGLNVITMRLPAAMGGVLTVLLIYYVGARLFDRKVGLLAAAFLTFTPWHITLSRWGHESSVCPLLALLVPAMLLWANFPFGDNVTAIPKPLRAAFAGAVSGIACYGYQAMRIFIPVFLGVLAMVTIPTWWRFVKTRKGLLSVAMFVVTFVLTFGPMVWQYIFHPEGIASHTNVLLNAYADLTFFGMVQNLLIRYISHFDPVFLFIQRNQFNCYMLPLMLAGLIAIIARFRQSLSIRTLLVSVLIYPVSDSLCPTPTLHLFRSSPGICGLVLLGAFGAVTVADWFYKRSRALALGLIGVFAVAVIVFNVSYLHYFYGEYNRNSTVSNRFHVDLLDASRWLRSRYDDYDAVFCTTDRMNMPYIITLVALNYDPHRWFEEPHKVFTYAGREWDYYARYGKMYFMYPGVSVPNLDQLRQIPSLKRVLFIVRPGELGLKDPVYRVSGPDGKDSLWLCPL